MMGLFVCAFLASAVDACFLFSENAHEEKRKLKFLDKILQLKKIHDIKYELCRTR